METIVDTYIDTTLPYPDVCTAAALCGPGGACKHELKSTNVIEEIFLLQNIAVNTARLLGNQVALVLAVSLIWAAFADVDDSFLLMPDALKSRPTRMSRDCSQSRDQSSEQNYD